MFNVSNMELLKNLIFLCHHEKFCKSKMTG